MGPLAYHHRTYLSPRSHDRRICRALTHDIRATVLADHSPQPVSRSSRRNIQPLPISPRSRVCTLRKIKSPNMFPPARGRNQGNAESAKTSTPHGTLSSRTLVGKSSKDPMQAGFATERAFLQEAKLDPSAISQGDGAGGDWPISSPRLHLQLSHLLDHAPDYPSSSKPYPSSARTERSPKFRPPIRAPAMFSQRPELSPRKIGSTPT